MQGAFRLGNFLGVKTEDRFASNGELISRSPLRAERGTGSIINNGSLSKESPLSLQGSPQAISA